MDKASDPNLSGSSALDVGAPSLPASQTAVTAPNVVKNKPPTNEPRPTTPLPFVPNAEPGSPIPKNGMQPGIALSDVRNEPSSDVTGSANKQPCNDSVAPLNSRGYVDPPVVGECEQCGGEIVRKSRNGRLPKFCSSSCRVKHWRRTREI